VTPIRVLVLSVAWSVLVAIVTVALLLAVNG